MYAYRIAERIHAVVPDMLNQLFLTDRASLVQQQIFQDTDFLSCEGKFLSPNRGRAGFRIKGKIPTGKHDIILRKLTQRKTAYACLEFLQMERFGEIIACSGIEPGDLVRNLASRRENQYPGILIRLPKLSENGHPVRAG